VVEDAELLGKRFGGCSDLVLVTSGCMHGSAELVLIFVFVFVSRLPSGGIEKLRN
jgi:hypothetical protein